LSTTKLSVLIPIYVDNELFGLLSLDSTDKNAFEEKSLPIFKSFSYFVSVMLKNQILQEKNIYLSKFDKLTGALNRSHFEDVFYEIHKKTIRYREEFTLCLIDLNHLKRTNDTHGHVMGDFLLNSFSNVIRNEIRDSDLFARYGGDEFIIIFFNSSNKETEEKVANIKDKFKNMKFNKNGVELDISFAYGLANFPDESMILDVLVKIADKKMYKDKLNYK
jgi:diguanylate cyclase (GGDEF)-like protein